MVSGNAARRLKSVRATVLSRPATPVAAARSRTPDGLARPHHTREHGMPHTSPRRAAGRAGRPSRAWRGAARGLAVAAAMLVASGAALGAGAGQTLAQQAPPAGASPLSRGDLPSGDVQAQLQLGALAPADVWCSLGPGGVTNAEGASDCAVGAGAPLGLRFPGLAPGRDLAVQVTPPGGAPQQATVPTGADGLAQWDWISQPGDPLGAYVVSATQDDRQVSGVFVVRQTTSPQVMTLLDGGPASARYSAPTAVPGGAFRVVLSGFAPGQPVPLRLYRVFGGTALFAADLGAVPADERGAASYTLRTAAGDPEGDYLVVTEPRVTGPGLARGALRLSSRADRPAPDPDADTNALT